MLKLPPFGRILEAYQQESIKLEYAIYIFMGQSASLAAYRHIKTNILCTYLPEGHDFHDYDWPIGNQKIVVQECGVVVLEDLHKFCLHLATFAPRVLFLHTNQHQNQRFIGDFTSE
jgi:hypothetical protein